MEKDPITPQLQFQVNPLIQQVPPQTQSETPIPQPAHSRNKIMKILIGVIMLVLLTGAVVGGYMFGQSSGDNSGNITDGDEQKAIDFDDDYVACTAEAKECPDGSFVNRKGSKCEFEECSMVIERKTSQANKETYVQVEDSNLLTQDNEFINKKYNYKISYSDIFEIVTPNPEVATSVNFRRKDDIIPAESGISIKVLESASELKNVCGTIFLENEGILCNKDTFKFTPMLDYLPWEMYEKDMVGIVPLGYVYASMHRDGNIYLINNYGYEVAEVDALMNNFKFIK